MRQKIKHCPQCKNQAVEYYNRNWRFDCDNGLTGIEINC